MSDEKQPQEEVKKMTKEEVELSTRKKVQAVQTLCQQLNLVLSAEQVVTEQGLIKQMVYYTDTEKYPMVGEEPNKPDEKTTTEPAPEAEAPADKPEAPAEEAKNETA